VAGFCQASGDLPAGLTYAVGNILLQLKSRATAPARGRVDAAGTWHSRPRGANSSRHRRNDAPTHFVGQSTILTLSHDRATGEAYCLAHHVTVDGSTRRLMVASLRYLDTFVKTDGAWLFSERQLYVDWVDERALS